MKFGYRDRIILLVAMVLVIFAIGIFAFIKPKWEKLNQNEKSYEDLSNQWDTKLAEFERIPSRQDTIIDHYEQGKATAEYFTDEKNSVELDEFIRNTFINTDKHIEDKVRLLGSLAVGDQGTATLNYNYVTPSILTYPLFEYADLDGSLAEATAAKMLESTILSARPAQTVGASSCDLSLDINREDIMALIDAVKKYAEDHKDIMIINSISFEDYYFNEDAEEEEGEAQTEVITVVDDDGNERQEEVPVVKTGENGQPQVRAGYTTVNISYQLFSMQEPQKPDVGPTYNPEIWNTDEWRTLGQAEEAAAEQ